MNEPICTCGHPLSNHGIQNGCYRCATNCNLTRDGVAQAARIRDLEAALQAFVDYHESDYEETEEFTAARALLKGKQS